MAFENISSLLHSGGSKRGMAAKVQAAMAVEYFNELAVQWFDKEARDGMRALYLKEGALVVAVLSPIIAQELKLREQEIISILNKRFRSRVIVSLRCIA